MTPSPESFEDSEELFVVHIVVQLQSGEGTGEESERMNSVVRDHREDRSQCVVGGVCLHNQRSTGFLLGECQSGGEGCLQGVERLLISRSPIPWSVLTSETGERNDNVRIEWNETTVEVREAEEGLNVLDLARDRPVEDDLDLVFGHRESV